MLKSKILRPLLTPFLILIRNCQSAKSLVWWVKIKKQMGLRWLASLFLWKKRQKTENLPARIIQWVSELEVQDSSMML